MSKVQLTFKIEKDGEEFHSWCPELEGCHSHGKTQHEALENLKDAVQLYLDAMMEEEITRVTTDLLDEA